MKGFLFLAISCSVFHSYAQTFSRISADFSIKEKTAAGDASLTMGRVYYDQNVHQLIYDVRFPESEKWLMTDTMMAKLVNGKIESEMKSPNIVSISIFALSLSGEMNSYGLKQTNYRVSDIVKEGDMIITTWSLSNPKLAKEYGDVLISVKDKKLFGVIVKNTAGDVISKQFFEEYANISGLDFPTQITQITYTEGKENYQVTTFKNILVNENQNDANYHFVLPVH